MNITRYNEDGAVEVAGAISVDVNNDIEAEESLNSNIEGMLEEDILPFSITPVLKDVKPLKIDSMVAFKNIKPNILKSFYVYLFIRDNTLSLVTDNFIYYIVDLNNIPILEIAKLLVYRNPKKVVVGMEGYKDLILEGTTNFWDLKFILKQIWDIDIKNAKELLNLLKVPQDGKKNIYLFSINLINIAKEINVFVEKNKLNSSLMLELDILKESVLCEKKGIPISIDKYSKFKDMINNTYNSLKNNMVDKYGDDFDFDDTLSIFNYLYKKECVPSLEPSILKSECFSLYNDLETYNAYKSLKKHDVKGNKFFIKYDNSLRYEVNVNGTPNKSFLGSEGILIEGVYNDLYLRVLTELTKDNRLIEATSTNQFLEYINKIILEDDKLGIYSEIFIRAYANNNFKPLAIQEFAESQYKTAISETDINYINNLFQEKAPELIDFFKTFNGNDVIYERYNKKIFQPGTNLDNYIKQIMSLVFKTAIVYVKASIDEYIFKYKNDNTMDIDLVGFYDYKILITTTEKSKPIGIDILNRYMALAYKEFILNTKYYNTTNVIV